MRDKQELISKPLKEDIVAYEHNINGGMVRVYVGAGHELDGKFVPLPMQTYEIYEIVDADYRDLMSDNGGNFRKDDLWKYIDRCRRGEDCRTIQRLRMQGLTGRNNNG